MQAFSFLYISTAAFEKNFGMNYMQIWSFPVKLLTHIIEQKLQKCDLL